MIIDPIDLKLIRQLELQGSISTSEFTNKFHITKDEILLRIKNFEDSGFISNYGVKLFLPRIVGGKWYWACVAIEATPQFRPEYALPYLDEIVENLTFPSGCSPDVSLLLYSQNPKEIYKRIYKIPGVKYAEIYKIAEYNVAISKVLVKTDWQIIAKLLIMQGLNYARINSILYEPNSETEVKLSGLIWTKRNRKGIVSIFPNFNWSVIKNYSHLHLAVTTKMRSKELKRIITRLGFSGNIASRFKKRSYQIEFDIWGFSDFETIIATLQEYDRLTIDGCSVAYKNRICNDWIKNYINEQL